MKKLLAIALLTVYLLNLTGYSLFFQYLINDADTKLVQRLDELVYDEKDLLEVKVPLNMPYLASTMDFVRVDGTLELNGVQYNYVKRKVAGDTLYLLCMPNFLKTRLCNAKTDISKTAGDTPVSKKNAETSSLKRPGAVNEYNNVSGRLVFSLPSLSAGSYNIFICPEILAPLIKSPVQPPDRQC